MQFCVTRALCESFVFLRKRWDGKATLESRAVRLACLGKKQILKPDFIFIGTAYFGCDLCRAVMPTVPQHLRLRASDFRFLSAFGVRISDLTLLRLRNSGLIMVDEKLNPSIALLGAAFEF